jgi:hypothetical protein
MRSIPVATRKGWGIRNLPAAGNDIDDRGRTSRSSIIKGTAIDFRDVPSKKLKTHLSRLARRRPWIWLRLAFLAKRSPKT